jgi:hypothetical protein
LIFLVGMRGVEPPAHVQEQAFGCAGALGPFDPEVFGGFGRGPKVHKSSLAVIFPNPLFA